MHRWLYGLGAVLLVGSACQPEASSAAAAATQQAQAVVPVPAGTDLTFYPGKGFGLIDVTATPAQLRERYGPEHVREERLYLQDGQYAMGAVVFGGTSEAVEVIYSDDGKPVFARVRARGSRWKTADGLGIGSSLADVEKANGRPFVFQGFGGELGGSVTDWLGGRYYYGVFIKLDTPNPPAVWQGDQGISSQEPGLQSLDIRVTEIMQRLDAAEKQY